MAMAARDQPSPMAQPSTPMTADSSVAPMVDPGKKNKVRIVRARKE